MINDLIVDKRAADDRAEAAVRSAHIEREEMLQALDAFDRAADSIAAAVSGGDSGGADVDDGDSNIKRVDPEVTALVTDTLDRVRDDGQRRRNAVIERHMHAVAAAGSRGGSLMGSPVLGVRGSGSGGGGGLGAAAGAPNGASSLSGAAMNTAPPRSLSGALLAATVPSASAATRDTVAAAAGAVSNSIAAGGAESDGVEKRKDSSGSGSGVSAESSGTMGDGDTSTGTGGRRGSGGRGGGMATLLGSIPSHHHQQLREHQQRQRQHQQQQQQQQHPQRGQRGQRGQQRQQGAPADDSSVHDARLVGNDVLGTSHVLAGRHPNAVRALHSAGSDGGQLPVPVTPMLSMSLFPGEPQINVYRGSASGTSTGGGSATGASVTTGDGGGGGGGGGGGSTDGRAQVKIEGGSGIITAETVAAEAQRGGGHQQQQQQQQQQNASTSSLLSNSRSSAATANGSGSGSGSAEVPFSPPAPGSVTRGVFRQPLVGAAPLGPLSPLTANNVPGDTTPSITPYLADPSPAMSTKDEEGMSLLSLVAATSGPDDQQRGRGAKRGPPPSLFPNTRGPAASGASIPSGASNGAKRARVDDPPERADGGKEGR
jgi:hypothetical protein